MWPLKLRGLLGRDKDEKENLDFSTAAQSIEIASDEPGKETEPSASRSSSQIEQLRSLSQSVRLEERGTPRLVQSTIIISTSLVVIFLVWASLANIYELARAPGEVVPKGFEQVVQHLEGGIVTQIEVNEGDLVEQGTTLLILDGSGAREDLARERKKHFLLSQQIERISAFLDGREPTFASPEVPGEELATGPMDFFKSMIDARERESFVIEKQLEQQNQVLLGLAEQQKSLEKNQKLLQDLYDRRKALHDRGHIAYPQVVEVKVRLNAMAGEYQSTLKKIEQANGAIGEFEQRLRLIAATHRDQAHDRLEKVRGDVAQSEEIISKLEARVGRLVVAAPVRGFIKGLSINTIGAVIQPGEELMSIVPFDGDLVIEARIPPQYIGRIKIGQPVQVSISSYDFARYGVMDGTLEQISATTFRDDRDGRYYKGRIRLARNYVGEIAEENRILPGMTVMVNIITGDKTVMDYLLKPIRTAAQTALSER